MKKMNYMLIAAAIALGTNAAEITKSGSNWQVDGGGQITINDATVTASNYFDGGNLYIGPAGVAGSNNRLVIDGATNVQVGGGSGNIYIGYASGKNNNTLALTNGATVSAGFLTIGTDSGSGSTGNRVILGEGSQLNFSENFFLYAGNTLEFAGGAMSLSFMNQYLFISTGSEIVVSGDYAVGETLISSWSGLFGTGNITNNTALLDVFNAAGKDRYTFAIDGTPGTYRLYVSSVIPEPASVLMVFSAAGIIAFFRRMFFSRK